MEIQLELHLPDPDQMPLDLQPQKKEEKPKQEPVRICIGNCNICRYCDNSNNR